MAEKNKKTRIKIIASGVGFVLLIFILKGMFPHKDNKKNASSKVPLQTATDMASGDTANETLKALSAQIQQVSDQNKQIIARDEKTQQENQQAIIKLQQQVQSKLQEVDQKTQQAQTNLEQKINSQQINQNNKKEQLESDYPLEHTSTVSRESMENEFHLSWVDDLQMKGASLDSASDANSFLDSKRENKNKKEDGNKEKENKFALADSNQKNEIEDKKTIPRYTIPANSVLADTTAMTGLIGRVPINGVVRDPYSFLLIIGPQNLAANGTVMPDVSKIMVSGTATGDMALSCVRGTITSLTFVFEDGTISTKTVNAKENQDNALGYLTSSTGNPCISGKFYTNAPEYLTTSVLLGAAQGAASAYSSEQTTSSMDTFGGSTSTVTGSPTKYVAGEAVVSGAGQAQKWWDQREQNSFDAVYVMPNTNVAIVITQEIAIDYNPVGRKVDYGETTKNISSTHLD